MAPPKITITCDCGEQRYLAYGESYVCSCGKSWSTNQIPSDDYARILALDRRYRRYGWALLAGIAGVGLAVLLTKPILAVVLVPLVLIGWFVYGRPIARRHHRTAISELTKTWKLRPQKGDS